MFQFAKQQSKILGIMRINKNRIKSANDEKGFWDKDTAKYDPIVQPMRRNCAYLGFWVLPNALLFKVIDTNGSYNDNAFSTHARQPLRLNYSQN